MAYLFANAEQPLTLVHMPKTGGTFVRERLGAVVGRPRKWGGSHGHVREVPLRTQVGSVVFGCIRDPWSWYASLWGHAMTLGDDGLAQARAWGDGSTDFRSVLYGLTHPSERPKHLRPFMVAINDGSLQRPQAGVWSWGLRYWFAEGQPRPDGRPVWAVDALCATDRLPDALASLAGVTVESEPINTQSDTGGASSGLDMYDEEMCAWVAEADADMIATFGAAPSRLAQSVYRLRGD